MSAGIDAKVDGTAAIQVGGTDMVKIDASGNLGVGVTPSAWKSNWKAIQNQSASFASDNNRVSVGYNWYLDSGAVDRYIGSDYATLYQQINGKHVFYRSASGTAGGAISFTEAMTLDADGILTTPKGGCQVISGTAVNASGTAVNFTGIPSWVKKITIQLANLSTNGTSLPQVQLGTSGGYETSSYLGSVTQALSTVSSSQLSAGILLQQASWTAASTTGGQIVLTLLNASTNTWAFSGAMGRSDAVLTVSSNGYKSLAGTLDRLRITTVNGTDSFDGGTVNILYE